MFTDFDVSPGKTVIPLTPTGFLSIITELLIAVSLGLAQKQLHFLASHLQVIFAQALKPAWFWGSHDQDEFFKKKENEND